MKTLISWQDIKFRALYKNQWIYFSIDDLIQINQESTTDKDYAILNHDPFTRCQSTGAKDVHKKDIYLFDIVEGDRIGVVRYIDYYFDFGQYENVTDVEGGIDPSELKIIGNIFDTPELLSHEQIFILKRDGIL